MSDRPRVLRRSLRTALTLSIGTAFCVKVDATVVPVFSAAQAESGKAAYADNCTRCHGQRLAGGEVAPPLRGYPFLKSWAGRSVGDLFEKIQSTMPPGGAGTLSDSVYVEIIAYILEAGGLPAGSDPLPANRSKLNGFEIPGRHSVKLLESGKMFGSGGLAPGVALPDWPTPSAPQEQLSAVTEEALRD